MAEHLTGTAPTITLTAVESGRRIALHDVAVPTVLLLFAQETSTAIDPVIDAVRAKFPTAEEVQIANVVDAHAFPRLLRKVPEMVMSNRYKDAAKNLEAGRDPAQYLIILPDWHAAVTKAMGIESVNAQIGVAVLAPGGKLIGPYQGPAPETVVLELLVAAGVGV
ncbi:MAG: hypothetical protein HYX53_09720 [Chloroflexi bacterium]|nr:hypothetical protein [Chloroflexota bacterium]